MKNKHVLRGCDMSTKIIAQKDGHTIEVNVDGPDVKVSVNGVKGSGCHAVTEAIESSLGKKVSSVATDEAYAAETTKAGARL